MDLGRVAAHADVAHAGDETGIQVLGAQEVHEGAAGIGIGDHVLRRDLGAVLADHADGAVVFHQHAADRTAGPDLRARRLGRVCQGLGNRAHAAFGQGEGAGRAADLAGQAVQQGQNRAGRAWAQVGAEHGVEGDRAAQQVAFEGVFQKVGHIHAADAQELAHVIAAQAADRPAEFRELAQIAPVAAAEARRHGRQHGLEMLGEPEHQLAPRRQGRAVGV